jgi:hypothetical protein
VKAPANMHNVRADSTGDISILRVIFDDLTL